jgi:hypothetical protein
MIQDAILGAQIGILLYGLYALFTGKFQLSKTRTVTGAYARLAGFVAMLPLPMSLLIRYGIARRGIQLPEPGGREAVDIVIIIICAVAANVIAYAKPPEEKAKTGW